MKLYLSSLPIQHSEKLLELVGKQNGIKVILVPTAWNTYPPERKQAEIKSSTKTFESFGFSVSLLDLADADEQAMRQALESCDIVWVMGGNTFYLNYQMHRSNFKTVARDFFTRGLVYGGDSAGAVVAGMTLHGIEHMDDPKLAPEIVWDGLKFVNLGVLPHWAWEKYGPSLEAAKQEMGKFTKVGTLRNDQAYIIDGEELEVVDNT